jgi:phage shock protein A
MGRKVVVSLVDGIRADLAGLRKAWEQDYGEHETRIAALEKRLSDLEDEWAALKAKASSR